MKIWMFTKKLNHYKTGSCSSPNILNALLSAKGPIVNRIEIKSNPISGHLLWQYDAASVLLKLACRCALDVSHLWQMPDNVRKFLKMGKNQKKAFVKSY